MSSALARNEEPDFRLDTSHLITEDDEPLDSTFQERQQRIMPDCLYASWKPEGSFLAFANVGLFHSIRKQAIVPDVLVSLGVEPLPFEQCQSYFVWEYGKPPDLVVEFVSRSVNSEDTNKLELYSNIAVGYYVIYDPHGYLSKIPLRVYVRAARGLIPQTHLQLEGLGLGLTIWEGEYQGCHGRYLRFVDSQGSLLLTGEELAKASLVQADVAAKEADSAKKEADSAKKVADSAKMEADSARREADSAKREADSAKREADSAKREAEQAQSLLEQERQLRQQLENKLRELGLEA